MISLRNEEVWLTKPGHRTFPRDTQMYVTLLIIDVVVRCENIETANYIFRDTFV